MSDITLITVLAVGGTAFLIAVIVALSMYFDRKRAQKLAAVAHALGLTFRRKPTPDDFLIVSRSHLARLGRAPVMSNVMEAPTLSGGERSTVFDFRYTVGYANNSNTIVQTVIIMHAPALHLPPFILKPESLFEKTVQLFGGSDIDFAEWPKFSELYTLRGTDEALIRQAFTPMVIQYCEQQPRKICLEGAGDGLLFYRPARRVKPEEVGAFVKDALEIRSLFSAA